MKYDVAIIGAGPAGIMAAISAAKKGVSVLLLEKNAVIGRKILATGNGRCNITNRNVSADNFYGGDKKFIAKVLASFDQNQTKQFFESLGLFLKEEDRGRMFPRTNQAKSVVEILEHELNKLKVKVEVNAEVKSIDNSDCWSMELSDGREFKSRSLIVTTGGKAAHQFGSSGDGIFWARKLGHNIENIYAALVPVEVEEDDVQSIQGIKVEAKAGFSRNGELLSEKSGDLIFTHYGLSGPAIMSQSRHAAPFLDSGIEVRIDLVTDKEKQELDKLLQNIFENNGAKTVKNALTGLIPMNLIPVIVERSSLDPEIKCANISKIQRAQIVHHLKNFTFKVTKLRPLKEAQVSRGGVDVGEIQDNLESKIIQDLYFAGEVLDVDGDSGGFNLQWAWSSGHLAGISASH